MLRFLLFAALSLAWPAEALWPINGHLEPGIVQEDLAVLANKSYIAAFIHSAAKDTQVEVSLDCDADADFAYTAQMVLRSSPCDKEFYEAFAYPDHSGDLLNIYFRDPMPSGEVQVPFLPGDYKQIYYYKGPVEKLTCRQGRVTISKSTAQLDIHDVQARTKRAAAPVEPAAKAAQAMNATGTRLPVPAIYLLLLRVGVGQSVHQLHNVTMHVRWLGPSGYLSAVDWPLLPFYGTMCAVYAIYALVWLIACLSQWKELLRIQFWIGAVIVLGMLEKALFYAEYQTLNHTGGSVMGAIQAAEVVSCLKRTLARMLIIIVSVGFGVVRPRLGATLHKVVGVGALYFLLSSVEALNRVSKKHAEGKKQKQMAGLPLTLLEVGIFWWIFSALLATTRALRLRRNEVKLSLYKHFTNTLIFAVIASVVFMSWSLLMHTFPSCLKDWTELWVDTAFWHVLFSIILAVIMILWRPTNNNQRYAFTPLLDASEDEDEDDTIFSDQAFVTAEALKNRGLESTTKAAKRGTGKENTLEEELKWVEENIPSSLADKALPALVDSDEEAAQIQFEVSKIQ